MDDLLDNSFIKDIYLPDSHDPNMKIETYERTKEENERLGLDLCDKGEWYFRFKFFKFQTKIKQV